MGMRPASSVGWGRLSLTCGPRGDSDPGEARDGGLRLVPGTRWERWHRRLWRSEAGPVGATGSWCGVQTRVCAGRPEEISCQLRILPGNRVFPDALAGQ